MSCRGWSAALSVYRRYRGTRETGRLRCGEDDRAVRCPAAPRGLPPMSATCRTGPPPTGTFGELAVWRKIRPTRHRRRRTAGARLRFPARAPPPGSATRAGTGAAIPAFVASSRRPRRAVGGDREGRRELAGEGDPAGSSRLRRAGASGACTPVRPAPDASSAAEMAMASQPAAMSDRVPARAARGFAPAPALRRRPASLQQFEARVADVLEPLRGSRRRQRRSSRRPGRASGGSAANRGRRAARPPPLRTLRTPREGRPRREHLVEHAPECPHVGAGVDVLALHLFRAHVARRADDDAGRRDRLRRHAPSSARATVLARPKSTTLTRPSGVSMTLDGLQIAVNRHPWRAPPRAPATI